MNRFTEQKNRRVELVFDTIVLLLTVGLFIYDDLSSSPIENIVTIQQNADPTFFISKVENPSQETFCYSGISSEYDQYICYAIKPQPNFQIEQSFVGPLKLNYIKMERDGTFSSEFQELQDKSIFTVTNYKLNLTLCDLIQVRGTCITGLDDFYVVSQAGLSDANIQFTSEINISKIRRTSTNIFVSSLMVFAMLIITMRFYARERKTAFDAENDTIYKKERNYLIDLEIGGTTQGDIREGEFRVSF
ncbi:hypothetical protein SS50377_20331 [Spironucleus salmonicida]|uniref:Transmembrane protein n=1 Tax=Spironucleus salmonicida TaxID=348837 RepID=V6LET9_9EUKA|nr:hypothetical protein SS50377_20331 [Spironucleus salmonicida]|eukprot:EST43012.1 Hypothetical protein SS50377_17313 [Spironucleus salmonicida]